MAPNYSTYLYRKDRQMAKGQKRSGRKARKPAQMRYTSEKRWEKNKKKRMAKHAKHLAKAAEARARRQGVAA